MERSPCWRYWHFSSAERFAKPINLQAELVSFIRCFTPPGFGVRPNAMGSLNFLSPDAYPRWDGAYTYYMHTPQHLAASENVAIVRLYLLEQTNEAV